MSYTEEEIAGLGGRPPGPAEPRDESERRIERALKVIGRHVSTDGAHHKQWVINQVVLALTAGALHLEDEGDAPVTITDQAAEPVPSLAAQALGLAFPDVPGFGGQGWSTQETALVVRWLFADPAAWEQAMGVARQYPGNPHTVADTLHEQVVPRSELAVIAGDGGDPAKVNWLEIAHELIERRDDPRPAWEHAGIAAQVTGLAADADAIPDPAGARVPDDPTAVSMFTAHRLDDTLHSLAHATERMQAARAATGDLRAYHSARVAFHLGQALDNGHRLTGVIRDRYPEEAAELEQVKQAVGLASGYDLNSRSGMISLDLPPGTVAPVPGGVDDHHITVVYLGPDVDDEAFAQVQERARQAAAAMPGPLTGTVGGIGTFPPSGSSDGKVPAWAAVVLPGAERVRSALEDLSASEHKDWKPHVTLAYVAPGEALPAPVPQTPVTFTHLSVHRGEDEVARFPLGGSATGLASDGGFTVSAQVIGLAKSLTPEVKAATTAHLLETTLHEETHGVRHAEAMLDTEPADVWEFNADHCEKHLGGAVEHAGKLAQHFRDNYPAVARWLDGLDEITSPGEGGDGKPQHARYAKSSGTVSAQLASTEKRPL